MKKEHQRQLEIIRERGDELGISMEETSSSKEKDIKEIGCRVFRLWDRKVKVISWAVKDQIVVVEVEHKGKIYTSRYAYPFHKIYNPAENFEVLDDIDYMKRHGDWIKGYSKSL